MTNKREGNVVTATGKQEGRPRTLYRVMLFDLKRRQEILEDEIEHLRDAIAYRLPRKAAGEQKTKNNLGSAIALLERLSRAADELHYETAADIAERERFESWWDDTVNKQAQPSDAIRAYQYFQQVWQAKMMIKASLIAERLGEIHDRLGQQLERTNPDHPNPVLRRRAEQGQIDKFLCEHVKWVHRDLVKFAMLQGATYPYTEVPATFYSWQYEASSSQHSFVSYKSYEPWKRWAMGGQTKGEAPRKFSSLGLSYWMPERLVSHPIIAHELAHQVLQDLYGRDSPYVRLEHQRDQLSRTLRRMFKCAEGWLGERDGSRHTQAQSWELVREIMCDLLATERYGCAYLHAWLTEISEIDELADFMHDSFGMLNPIHDFKKEITLEYIQREIVVPSRALATTVRPDIYYRGKVLIGFIRAQKRETDVFARELLDQVDTWLERYMDLATGISPASSSERTQLDYAREFEYQFAQDLKLTVTEEYGRASRMLSNCGFPSSAFVAGARRHWKFDGCEARDFSLGRQVMSEAIKERYLTILRKYRSDVRDTEMQEVRTLHDALWRVEWAIETHHATKNWIQNDARNEIRALNFLATDEYLLSTGNPFRLLQAVLLHRLSTSTDTSNEADEHAGSFVDDMTRESNTVDERRLRRVYEPKWLKDADKAIREKKAIEFELDENSSFSLSSDEAEKLAALKLQPEDFEQLGLKSCSLHVMHLVSLKPARTSTAQMELVDKYGHNLNSSLLLGRYDAIAIGPMPPGERGDVAGKRREQDKALEVKGGPSFCSVSRLKRLVPIGVNPVEAPGPDQFLAVVLISLRWDASRILFAKWLRGQSVLAGKSVFLSDGWEDVVVVVPLRCGEDMATQIRGLANLIEMLNNSPLVAGTETLLSPCVLDSPTDLQYRFVCTRGPMGLLPTRSRIEGALVPGLELQNLSGAKDFQILVRDKSSRIHEAYIALHSAAEKGGFRVETRVSWTSGIGESESPREDNPPSAERNQVALRV
jgi:hypothetical protein